MKITEIRINRLNTPRRELKTQPRRQPWAADAEVANPMSRYPKVKRHRSLWLPKWGGAWVQVVAEDGTWGLGVLNHAAPCAPVVEHLATHLVGEDCMAIDKLADMMFRLTKPYGSTGLASYAISALDLALWDLKGKLLGQPVYSLLGGPQKERLFCYATGNDVDWYQDKISEPATSSKSDCSTPNQVTKAAPCARRHSEQWQWAHHLVGGVTSNLTAPQRHPPEKEALSLIIGLRGSL